MLARMFSWLVWRCALLSVALGFLVWAWFSLADRALPTREQMAALMTSGEIKRDRVGQGFETKCLLPLPQPARGISPALRAVVIGTEDRGFDSELFGLSPKGLAGAVAAALHGHARGGSTITQQLVKNLLFEPGDGVFLRKIYEIPWAVAFHRRFSAQEILSAYLDHLPFRHGLYGIEAASLYYFGKSAADLNYPEAALIEVMLSSPRNDLKGADPEAPARARAKARHLLRALVHDGLVPRSALAERERPGTDTLPDLGCGYLRDHVEREIRAMADAPPGSYRAYVTVDSRRQAAAVAALAAASTELKQRGAGEAAVVGLDRAGGIQAFVGGLAYGASQFDRAGNARRSPGSVGKVLVLAEACERGYGLSDIVDDVAQPGGRPADDDGRYLGRITLGDAFRLSRNAAMFGLERALGHDAVAGLARRLGIGGTLPEDGGFAVGDFAATPLAMTALMAGIANGGYPVTPFAVRGIVGHHGRILYWHEDVLPASVLSARCVDMLDRALRSVVTAGTGRQADLEAARGKTGTSNAFRDAWFVGYTGPAVAGVWVGNDDDRAMGHVEGGGLPARIFRAYLRGSALTMRRGRVRPVRLAGTG